jgi:hypothetical protein
MGAVHFPIVIPREGGVSSIPRRQRMAVALVITGLSVGACHRAALRADPLADDDNKET